MFNNFVCLLCCVLPFLPSFCDNFNIPEVTLTSALSFDNQTQSDICSVFSLTDSLQSDKCLSDFIPDDRWSLCSFASRTSSASRYTSVETLLDQTNRKPIIKSGSKLLNVARYFTSSKLRRKFSQKKKHKSILRRKFSVIEEYKQKGNSSLGVDIDEMVQNSMSEFERKNSCKLERVPTVEEEASCTFFDKSESNRSMYFNLSNLHFSDGKIGEVEISGINSVSGLRKPESVDVQPEIVDKTREQSFIRELNECIIADDSFKPTILEVNEELLQNEKTKQEDSSPDDEIRQIFSSTPVTTGGSKFDTDDRQAIEKSTTCDEVSCSTPPISEMIPYCMSPPLSDMLPVKASVPPRERQKWKAIQFERNFLKTLRRNDVGDYFSISNSPEIQRLSLINGKHKSVLKSSSEICLSTGSVDEDEINREHSVSSNVLCKVDPVNSMAEESNNENSSDAKESSALKLEYDAETRNFSTLPMANVNQSDSLDEFIRLNYSIDDSYYVDTNKTNCDVPIITADDNCNILREALTSSRLLMHANNPDRNISEGDKEDNTTKREGVVAVDNDKNKSSSDAGMLIKCHDYSKETSQEKDQLNAADRRGRNVLHRENFELMEYPFLTLTTYPEEFIIHLGGTVSARSVKLLDRISNPDEPETRDAWWTELRIEIKSHMRALACNVVLNYTESTSICEEVCLLNATGTAALVRIYDSCNTKATDDTGKLSTSQRMNTEQETKSEKLNQDDVTLPPNCSIFHIPYRKSSLPFPVNIKTCQLCRKGFVADVAFVTIEPLVRMPVIGQSTFIHAFVFRPKRDCKSELNAREISEGLPFLEYELNRQLINKLRIKGMNAVFGLNVNVSIGEKMIAAYATGTAMLLSALPPPPELTLAAHSRTFTLHPTSRKKLNDLCKVVEDSIKQNKIHYQLIEHRLISDVMSKTNVQNTSCDIAIQDQYPDMEYFANSKQTCVIEVDDEDDLEAVTQLIDSNLPQGFFVSATEEISFGSLPYVAKKNIQLFAQVYRYRIPSNTPPGYFNKCFHRIVQGLYMKIHHRIPCSLNKVSFKINIPDSDEIQIRIVGMALALKEPERLLESVSTSCSSVSELADDLILSAENERDPDMDSLSSLTPVKHTSIKREKRTGVFENEVHVTSLSYIPGANINFYLGNLNFVFIRESAMVKEQPGGANNFVSNFLSDVIAVVKSHAVGIGGNAVVNFFLSECLLTTHSHKNQGQCLTHVGGDVVRYVYRTS